MGDNAEKRCRHNRHWLYVTPGGRILWCYECGALRTQSGDDPFGRWVRPVGKGGENPALAEVDA